MPCLVVASIMVACDQPAPQGEHPVVPQERPAQPAPPPGPVPAPLPDGAPAPVQPASVDHWRSPPPEFRTCTSPSECTIVDGPCGGPVAIRADHAKRAATRFAQMMRSYDCAGPRMGEFAQVACENGQCVVIRIIDDQERAPEEPPRRSRGRRQE
jgi:hypothetical protein